MSDYHVTVSPHGVTIEFDVGSIAEVAGMLQDNETALAEIMSKQFGPSGELLTSASTVTVTGDVTASGNVAAEPPKPSRGRPRKNAEAPAPVQPPVAAAPPAPPAAATPAEQVKAADGIEIPDFLDRNKQQPPAPPAPPVADAAPPPPPPPPAMPAAAAPAVAPGVLGGKVADELTKRATGAPDGGAGLVTWLRDSCHVGLVPGATFDEAMGVVRFTPDDKAAPIARALGIA